MPAWAFLTEEERKSDTLFKDYFIDHVGDMKELVFNSPELGLGSEVHFSPGLDSRVGTSYQSRPRTDPEPVPIHNRPGRVRTTGYKGLD